MAETLPETKTVRPDHLHVAFEISELVNAPQYTALVASKEISRYGSQEVY